MERGLKSASHSSYRPSAERDQDHLARRVAKGLDLSTNDCPAPATVMRPLRRKEDRLPGARPSRKKRPQATANGGGTLALRASRFHLGGARAVTLMALLLAAIWIYASSMVQQAGDTNDATLDSPVQVMNEAAEQEAGKEAGFDAVIEDTAEK